MVAERGGVSHTDFTAPKHANEHIGGVLVVDDDPLVAEALRLSLSREGYRVQVADSVEQAKRAFETGGIDVVLTDLIMPGGSGIELLHHIEVQDPLVPVIIITADESVQAAAQAVRGRAFDYMTKPVSREAVTGAVRRAMDTRRQHQLRLDEQEKLREDHRQLAIRHQRTAMLLSVLFDRAVEGIIVFDGQGRVMNASESFVALVGVPLYELFDLDAGYLFEPHPLEGDIQSKIAELATVPLVDGNWRGDVTIRASRARSVPARLSLSVCDMPGSEDTQVRYVVGLLYYETAHEELSRQLQQADRLATIGLLAGSAAHEIKNDLGPLLGYLSLIEGGGQDPVASGMIGLMRDSVRRVNEHVEQILAPLRPRVRTRGAVVLSDSITDILQLLRKAGRLRRVKIDMHTGNDDVIVHADKDELHQIAVNLITNALDSLGDGGGAERGCITISLHTEDEFGVLEIADTGSGIPAHIRARVFEPFFTTKGAAGGTGLGLPVVHDIVRLLRGRLSLKSREGQGTVVTARLPLYQPARG